MRGETLLSLEQADPAELKEFVERDVLAARGKLAAALAARSSAVNLWEAYVWSFVLTGEMGMVIDAARSGDERKALELFFARAAMGRPFVAPPGVPADRLAALRTAFDAAIADPAFLEDASKLNLNVVPVSAREMTEIVNNAYKTPPDVVQRTIRALGRGH